MFYLKGKEYQIDKTKVLYKTIIPIVSLFLLMFPIIGLFPCKIPVGIFFLIVLTFLILNVCVMMIPWDKDTEVYRIQHKYVNKFLNKVTTIQVYAISIIVSLGIASIVFYEYPNHAYTEHHLDELYNVTQCGKFMETDSIYLKKTDTYPLEQCSLQSLKKTGIKENEYFMAYQRSETVSLLSKELSFKHSKIICKIDSDAKKVSYYMASSKSNIGAITSVTCYPVVVIPASYFE